MYGNPHRNRIRYLVLHMGIDKLCKIKTLRLSMEYKLTDDQKDLIMTILYDLDNIEDSEIIENINMKSMLSYIYNNGKYEDSHREILNSIREFWMNNIYNKGYSTWDYIRESPV